jgi:virginiamycin B lyase
LTNEGGKPKRRLPVALEVHVAKDATLKRLLILIPLVASLSGGLSARAQDLPEGPGKDLVANTCNLCHDINRIKVGYTPEGWRTVIRMMQNVGAPLQPDAWPIVTDYLIKNFPERPRPAAAIIPGPVQATIQEWPVPTPGSRPHDPLATKDGEIWWTGQLANKLGRVDPKTGQTKEFTLNTTNTGPHGLVEDKDGNIWFTGNTGALIGKLDPKTGAVKEYPMPDPQAKDPHTLIFDRDGILWFTVQHANMVGRLDPKTGEIKLVTSPTPKSRPYGMALNSKNTVFFVEFGTNKVASIDGAMKIHEYPLPDPGARPRRIAITPDDMIWYTDFARGFLGRLDPATGAVTEWPSPSGPKSEPYGIVSTKGALWYSESAAKPNTIVRFDPKTQKFQTWAIPGGGDIVRNMDVAPNGDPVLANSLVNEVGRMEIR